MRSVKPMASYLNCALSTSDEDEHLCTINDCKKLSCNHCVCNSCLNGVNDEVYCNHCKKMSKVNHQIGGVSRMFNVILNYYKKDLLENTYEKFANLLKNYTELIKAHDSYVDTETRLAQESIDVRIESMKMELDNLRDSFHEQLNESSVIWKKNREKWLESNGLNEFEIEGMEEDIIYLEHILIDPCMAENADIYRFEKHLKILQNKFKIVKDAFKHMHPSFYFTPQNTRIGQSLVGELNTGTDSELIKTIKGPKYELVSIGCNPCDMCMLPNGDLLIVCYEQILLLDQSMELIKVTDSINNKKFRITRVATDGRSLYFCDRSTYSIIKTDMEFRKLAVFENYHPVALCCYNDCVFVCDSVNKSLIKLDSNLKLVSSVKLIYKPWYIKNIDNVAIVSQNSSLDVSVCFYDLDNFNLIKIYKHHDGIIGTSDAYFYQYDSNNQIFYCYDKQCNIVDKIETAGFGIPKDHVTACGSIVVFKTKLLMPNHLNHLIYFSF